MIKTIQIKDAINNHPNGRLSKISGVDASGHAVTDDAASYLNEYKLPVSLAVGGGKGLFHTPFKYIGTKTGDGVDSVMLIAPYSEGKDNMCGVVGRMFFTRGSAVSALFVAFFDVIAVKAFMSFGTFSSDSRFPVVKCTYNGNKYLAIRLASRPLFDVYFSGIYSENCIFQHVLSSDVQFT